MHTGYAPANLWNVTFSGLLCRSCSSGLIGILPDSTAGLLRFKCVLTLIVVLMMVSALKPDYVGRFCHNAASTGKGSFHALGGKTAAGGRAEASKR